MSLMKRALEAYFSLEKCTFGISNWMCRATRNMLSEFMQEKYFYNIVKHWRVYTTLDVFYIFGSISYLAFLHFSVINNGK